MKVVLYAHPDYWDLSKEEKKDICNGCGAKGAWYNFLIPGKVFKQSCNIHDYDYFLGKNQKDKKDADRRFYQNNKRIVNATKNPLLKRYRSFKAKAFFKAVDDFGEEAFWSNKIVNEKNSKGKEIEI